MRVLRIGVMLGLALASGCATDLRVGVDTEAGSGESGSEATGSTLSQGGPDGGEDPTIPDTGPTESASSSGDTTSATASVDPTGEVGSTGEGDTTPEPTSDSGEPATETGAETTEDPTGDPPRPCTAETEDGCLEDPMCIWIGGEPGECTIDPCENPEHECLELGFEACVDAPGCAWVGEPELGECGPIVCVPCEALDAEQCAEVEGCDYDEGEMVCLEI